MGDVKKISVCLVCGALGVVLGFLLARSGLVRNFGESIEYGGEIVKITHFHGYPIEVFEQINFELTKKLDEIFGPSQEYLFVVLPHTGGYEVKIANRYCSDRLDAHKSEQISEWIATRMRELDLKRQKSEPDRGYSYGPEILINEDSHDYSMEVFEKVNAEVRGKINEIFGQLGSQEYMFVVLPASCGYRLQIARPYFDKPIDEEKSRQLKDWIRKRIDELDLETRRIKPTGEAKPASPHR